MPIKEMSIKEITKSLQTIGFGISLEEIAEMRPAEIKQFVTKAHKVFEAYYTMQREIARLKSQDKN